VKRVLSFLGERWEPDMLELVGQLPATGFADRAGVMSRRITPSTGAYRSWSQETIDAVLTETAEFRSGLGYLGAWVSIF